MYLSFHQLNYYVWCKTCKPCVIYFFVIIYVGIVILVKACSYLGGAPLEGELRSCCLIILCCVLSSITKKGEIERTSLSFGDLMTTHFVG